MLEMIRKEIVPASISYSSKLAESVASKKEIGLDASAELELCRSITNDTSALLSFADKLDEDVRKTPEDVYEAARYSADVLIPDMDNSRGIADHLETVVDKKEWPMPTYSDILFYC